MMGFGVWLLVGLRLVFLFLVWELYLVSGGGPRITDLECGEGLEMPRWFEGSMSMWEIETNYYD